jgi:endonuclease G
MRDLDARLKALISTFDTADEPLADEIRALRRSRSLAAPGASASRRKPSSQDVRRSSQLSLRNIVLRVGRPVLAVVGDVPQIQFTDGQSEVWRSRLQASADRLRFAARAVGRIDVIGLPRLQYVGTGWLVDKHTIATKRHVAREFGRQIRGRFAFKKGSGAKPIRASINFLEEVGRSERLEFQIVEILHIEDEEGPDFALLRVEET